MSSEICPEICVRHFELNIYFFCVAARQSGDNKHALPTERARYQKFSRLDDRFINTARSQCVNKIVIFTIREFMRSM